MIIRHTVFVIIYSVLYILWFNWSFLMTNKFYKIQFARTPSKTALESFFCKGCGGLIVSSLLFSVANSSYKRKDKHRFKILWSLINLFGILWVQMLVAILKYSLFLKHSLKGNTHMEGRLYLLKRCKYFLKYKYFERAQI